MMKQNGRILGLDFGTKRIGVAVSDPMQVIAQGISTIEYRDITEAMDELETLNSQYCLQRIIIGYPLTLNGTIGKAAQKTEKFIKQLKKKFDLPISLFDERFTSVIAENTLKEAGKSPNKNKSLVDQISATLILQDYLDKQKNKVS